MSSRWPRLVQQALAWFQYRVAGPLRRRIRGRQGRPDGRQRRSQAVTGGRVASEDSEERRKQTVRPQTRYLPGLRNEPCAAPLASLARVIRPVVPVVIAAIASQVHAIQEDTQNAASHLLDL